MPLPQASSQNHSRRRLLVPTHCLSAETVEGSSLSLERVDDVERGDGLSLGVLSVGDRVSDDVLEAGALEAALGRGRGGTYKILRTPRVSS